MAKKLDLIGYVYRYRVFLAVLVLLAMPVGLFLLYMQSPTQAADSDEPYSIFIVAGQSNAEGSNAFRSDLPAGTGFSSQNHPADAETGLWLAGADGKGPEGLEGIAQVFSGQNPAGWYDSNDGTGNKLRDLTYVQRNGTIGSEVGFARAAYEKGRRKVIILKVTYGFQTLAKSTSVFVPFDFNTESGPTKSYNRMKTEFNLLTEQLKTQNKKYTVDGLFWIQGETDTLQESYASAYQENFTKFVNAARTDFQMSPLSHIVAAKISLMNCVELSYPTTGDYCGFPYAGGLEPLTIAPIPFAHPLQGARMRKVRDALQYVADHDQDSPVKVDVVETVDLPRGRDWIHMTTAAQIELGRRFANMYQLPLRYDSDSSKLSSAADYDGDGILNPEEDTGDRACGLTTGTGGANFNNGNLGDDDCDGDGYPNYLDRVNGVGNGL